MKRVLALKSALNKTAGRSTPAAMPMVAGKMGRRNRYKRQPLTPMITATPDDGQALAVLPASEPEWVPTMTMNRQVARARREMGEARWAELEKEWQ